MGLGYDYCLSFVLFVCLSVCLSDRLSVRLSVCLSACLTVCVSVCLTDCLSACLTDCLSAWTTRLRATALNSCYDDDSHELRGMTYNSYARQLLTFSSLFLHHFPPFSPLSLSSRLFPPSFPPFFHFFYFLFSNSFLHQYHHLHQSFHSPPVDRITAECIPQYSCAVHCFFSLQLSTELFALTCRLKFSMFSRLLGSIPDEDISSQHRSVRPHLSRYLEGEYSFILHSCVCLSCCLDVLMSCFYSCFHHPSVCLSVCAVHLTSFLMACIMEIPVVLTVRTVGCHDKYNSSPTISFLIVISFIIFLILMTFIILHYFHDHH